MWKVGVGGNEEGGKVPHSSCPLRVKEINTNSRLQVGKYKFEYMG